MDHAPRGGHDIAQDPRPSVRGLDPLIPEQRLAAILSRTARSSERRRCLPADSVIGRVLAMALFTADSIPKVWRRRPPTRDRPEPTASAFSRARRRLGVASWRPLFLFLETARPMATHQTPGVTSRGGHRMGLDGTTLDRPDTPENAPPLRSPHHRPGRGGVPPGPMVGPLGVGHARRLRPDDHAAVSR